MKTKSRCVLVAYNGRYPMARAAAVHFYHGVALAVGTTVADGACYLGEFDFLGGHLSELPALYPGLAAIIVHRNPAAAKLLVDAFGKKMPVLSFGSSAYTVKGASTHWVATDEEEVVRRAMEHLYARGHRQIGIVVRHGQAQAERHACWRRWMQARGLPALGLELDLSNTPALEYFRNTRRLKSFLARTTAVFATTDPDLPPLVHAAAALGAQLPRDLSVLGVDNLDLCAAMKPMLSSIDLNQEAAGARCVEALVRFWNGDRTPIHEFAPVTLVERQSVARLAPAKRTIARS